VTLQASTMLRTLAFGALPGGPWGFVWSDPNSTVAVIGEIGADAQVRDLELAGDPEAETWSLHGDGVELSAVAGHGQLCELTGTVRIGGTEHTVQALGVRTTLSAPEPSALDSLRIVLVWFSPEDGVAFAAVRPRGASGQERDEVQASVVETSGTVAIDDGRLSTTYAAGAPKRMSLELWIDDEEDSFPRRAAGEVIGSGAELKLTGLTADVRVLHAHRAGHDGLGVYVLARPR
jgi:hypothetical protein